MAAVNLLSPTNVTILNEHANVPSAVASMFAIASPGLAKIEKIVATNTHATNVHPLSIGICQAASVGAIGNSAWHLKGLSVAAGESIPLGDYLEGAWLGDGDCIFAVTDSGTDLTIVVSLTVFT